MREWASLRRLLSWACLYSSSKRYLFFWIFPGSFLPITAELALLRLIAEVGWEDLFWAGLLDLWVWGETDLRLLLVSGERDSFSWGLLEVFCYYLTWIGDISLESGTLLFFLFPPTEKNFSLPSSLYYLIPSPFLPLLSPLTPIPPSCILLPFNIINSLSNLSCPTIILFIISYN